MRHERQVQMSSRRTKSAEEKRVIIPTRSLSGVELYRFQQAYRWRHGEQPTQEDIKIKVRRLLDDAITAYIEAAENDQRASLTSQ
jgi:hypothetical protein